MNLRSISLLVLAQWHKPEIHHCPATYQTLGFIRQKCIHCCGALCHASMACDNFEAFQVSSLERRGIWGRLGWLWFNTKISIILCVRWSPNFDPPTCWNYFWERAPREQIRALSWKGARCALKMFAQVLTIANRCSRKTQENQGNIWIHMSMMHCDPWNSWRIGGLKDGSPFCTCQQMYSELLLRGAGSPVQIGGFSQALQMDTRKSDF